MGCPYIGRQFNNNRGLPDPAGKSDEVFMKVMYMPPGKLQLHGVITAPLPLDNRSSIMIVAHESVTTNIRRSWCDRLLGNIAAS